MICSSLSIKDMVDVNANYEKIQAEAGRWETMEDAALMSSLQDVLLPLVNDSLDKLATITPATTEVQSLKTTYTQAMTAYKEGFSQLLRGLQAEDEEQLLAGNDTVNEALQFISEYNAAMKALAEECGLEVTY